MRMPTSACTWTRPVYARVHGTRTRLLLATYLLRISTTYSLQVKEVFNVLHYAGAVSYSVASFLDKNNDTVRRDYTRPKNNGTRPKTP